MMPGGPWLVATGVQVTGNEKTCCAATGPLGRLALLQPKELSEAVHLMLDIATALSKPLCK